MRSGRAAVNIWLDTDDVDLPHRMARRLRTGQAGVVALAPRHLTESIERGQPIYLVVENVEATRRLSVPEATVTSSRKTVLVEREEAGRS